MPIVDADNTRRPTLDGALIKDHATRQIKRIRLHRNQMKNGLYAWYQDYALPEACGGGTVTVRLHGTREDEARGLNRPENLSDPAGGLGLLQAVCAPQRLGSIEPDLGRHLVHRTGA